MNTNIKLIASDLDGTLIPEGTQRIESGFIDEILKQINDGKMFFVASGRPYSGAAHFFKEIIDKTGFICENGALVIENGEVTFVDKIPDDIARSISEFVINDDRVDPLISGVRDHYIVSKTKQFDDGIKSILKESCQMITSVEQIDEPIIKIAMYVYDFEKNGQVLKDLFTEKYGDVADFVFSGNDWLDMIMKGSGKGKALSYIMNRENIRADQLLVFGDNENDLSMLTLTPNSYAKDHSSVHVKEQAGYVCNSVVKALKSFDKIGKLEDIL